MTALPTNPKVDFYFAKPGQWHDAYARLREIILAHPLTEDLKWGEPCYTHDKRNIVLIHGFKDYSAVLFFKGALLNDPEGLLTQQTQNVQSARQIRFADLEDITGKRAALDEFIEAAIAVEKAGLKVELKKAADFAVAEEFQVRLEEDSELKAAFEALTPGRQKAYLLHFSSAKQSATRAARVEKATPQILAGKGLDD